MQGKPRHPALVSLAKLKFPCVCVCVTFNRVVWPVGVQILKNYTSEDSRAMGYVRFSDGYQADKTESAQPHVISGQEVEVRRVVSPKETVSKLLSSHFKEDRTKIGSDAAVLMAEMLKVFVQEAAMRSMKQAQSEDCDRVHVEHLEKVLPQLVGH
ncbi:hypothetical protein NHX12_032308 [Muraenolepis orangiensis]|uniref:Centromere protein X n=1 Tax=Muraenolepis orangiensis TaxID=630683 RepID=A0A9Q0EBA6_9TELE|nr:hypothetical protein NHX12_032308 [Muraenolepis orangiensis]